MDTGFYLTIGSVSAMAAFMFCFIITLYIISLRVFGGGMVLISVKDNGSVYLLLSLIGFSSLSYNKTNRTGTGLGLSLSYDIIKAHGGEMKVEAKEGGGVEFIIQLAF